MTKNKKLWGLVLAIALFAAFVLIEFSLPVNYDRLNLVQRYIVRRINTKWLKIDSSVPKTERALLDYNYLLSVLNVPEREFAGRILRIDPVSLGFKGGYSSIASPENIVRIRSISLEAVEKGVTVETGVQYYPKAGYEDFEKMMAAMKKDIGKRLYVDSGYRSPGRQLFLFFYYLMDESGYSLKKNASMVAMPGYSQHNDPVNTAMDMVNMNGISGERQDQIAATFATLEEFSWLQKHASKYHFHLSYPAVNQWGITFEPWHWQYKK